VSHLWRHRAREARVPLQREARHARGGRDDFAGRERATRQRLSRHIVRYRSLAARPRAWFGGCFATSLASSRHSARPCWDAFKVLFGGVAHPVRSPRPISSRRTVGVTRGIGVSAPEWTLDHVYHASLYPNDIKTGGEHASPKVTMTRPPLRWWGFNSTLSTKHPLDPHPKLHGA
jgi:hypothetical protein